MKKLFVILALLLGLIIASACATQTAAIKVVEEVGRMVVVRAPLDRGDGVAELRVVRGQDDPNVEENLLEAITLEQGLRMGDEVVIYTAAFVGHASAAHPFLIYLAKRPPEAEKR